MLVKSLAVPSSRWNQSEQMSEEGVSADSSVSGAPVLSNADFRCHLASGYFFRSPQQIASDPCAWFYGFFEFVARHGIRLSLEAERRVLPHQLYLEEYFASSRPLWPKPARDCCRLPHAALALRAMHETRIAANHHSGVGPN